MKNKLLLFCASLLLFSIVKINAQTYYYSDTVQIPITENKSSAVFYYKTAQDTIIFNDPDTLISFTETGLFGKAIAVTMRETWTGTKDSLQSYLGINEDSLNGSSFSFALDGGYKMYPTFQVVIKLKNGYTLDDISTLLSDNDLTYIRASFGIIIAASDNPLSSITAANTVNNDSKIEWSHPDFLLKVQANIDPLYDEQYYLHDHGQTVSNHVHLGDIDIDAPEAWNITTGLTDPANPAIKIAVIDMGVEDHPDLYDDQSSVTRVLPGHDVSTFGGNGHPVNAIDNHGECVAGIIAASHNNIGVRGLCPKCYIVPVRMDLFNGALLTPQQIADAINWAWDIGEADILSNSWTFPANCGQNLWMVIDLAIDNAISSGRGGKGCPVIFSAGNNGNTQTCINYPANYITPTGIPVMAISGLTQDGVIASSSNVSVTLFNHISVAAFYGGYDDPPTCCTDIRTIDRVGSAGYNLSGDYLTSFGGTSAACPMVTGVAALLLSMDPNLTESQIRCRIEESATDIGPFGFDDYNGHGRLDAYYAVAINNLDLIDDNIYGLQHYSTHDYITSGAGSTIKSTANVTLTAGKAITLNPGFKTETSAVFLGQISSIGPCGTLAGGPYRLADHSSNKVTEAFMKIEDFISIKPNPARFNILIAAKHKNIQINKLILYNLVGEKINELNITPTDNFMLNISSLLPGMYFVQSETNHGKIIKKIIKQ